MSEEIVVKIRDQGQVAGEQVTADTDVDTTCSGCGQSAEAVASVGGASVCADCMRARLDAISVARYQLRGGSALPWGKVTS